MSVIVYGADYSVYTRIVRMALKLKGAEFQLEPVDIFDKENLPDGYADQHPFQKIPALKHNDFFLYETGAICRYLEATFPSPALMPEDARDCARINQIISIMDNYAYPCWVWEIAVERMDNDEPDEAKIQAALPRARTCLGSLEILKDDGPGLVGQTITLADVYGIATIHYFVDTPEGTAMLGDFPGLSKWWQALSSTAWVTATAPPEDA